MWRMNIPSQPRLTVVMPRRMLRICLIGALFTFPLAAQAAYRLQTKDTEVIVTATDAGPCLTQIQEPAGTSWINRKCEALPDHVEIAGERQAVHWALNSGASRKDTNQILIAYNSAPPRLKLAWESLPADWKPEPFKGQTIDLGAPAARQWAQAELDRMISDYQLDMLEHDGYLVAQGCIRSDHAHAPPDPAHTEIVREWGSYFVVGPNSTEVSYHAVNAYYSIYEELRKQHPGLLFEICDDGGRMVDFGSAAHGDYFSITDTYDPLSNRRAFYDASFVLPPAMLEDYVEKWPAPTIDNFRYMLRSGMLGWLTI